jgi:hypothetical protein
MIIRPSVPAAGAFLTRQRIAEAFHAGQADPVSVPPWLLLSELLCSVSELIVVMGGV